MKEEYNGWEPIKIVYRKLQNGLLEGVYLDGWPVEGIQMHVIAIFLLFN